MELPEGGEPQKRGRKPGQRRRTPLEIARDRSLINDLRLLKRKSISEIARIVSEQYLTEIVDEEAGTDKDGKRPPHVGIKQVRLELEGCIEDYKDSRAEEIHAKRLGVIRQYERLAGYAFEEYEKSANDKVTETEQTTDNQEHGETKTEKTVVEKRFVGEPSFLRIVLDCTNRVAELESIIPPRKTALTNPDGTEPFKFEGSEEIKRLSALAQELLNPGQGSDQIKETS